MIISTLSLKLTIQPDIYQTKLLWIISAFILSQNHHLYLEITRLLLQNASVHCPEDF